MRPTIFLLALLLAGCSAGVGVGTATVTSAPDGTVTATGNAYGCGVAVPGGPPRAGCAPAAGRMVVTP
ncbi:hypothetical protein [Methylobrevis pamukkalensis]|uniref:Lipoprotein n=1 Tax=Methylobrevis pamukkalensis TaxID=1439726 RepID=A0A1E3GZA1_9HYPH|nr:hypothetical protein [Methylobrevis pamukkalensis]ODN69409.1 hypothetical protein A6302_03277 [Methylobrevis pamukkalensis]